MSGKPGNGSWKAVSKLMYSQGITGQYLGNFFERFALKFVAQVMAVTLVVQHDMSRSATKSQGNLREFHNAQRLVTL